MLTGANDKNLPLNLLASEIERDNPVNKIIPYKGYVEYL